MKYVKPAASVAAAIAIGSSAQAGNLVEPVMESEVVMAEEVVVAGTTGSGGFVIPLLLLVIFFGLLANGKGIIDVILQVLSKGRQKIRIKPKAGMHMLLVREGLVQDIFEFFG